jgi:predicted dehydrogenase
VSGAGPVGVGIIGAGTISDTYLDNLDSFADTDVLAIGDLFPEAAAAKAAAHGVATHGGVEAVLDHPDVEIVINLTIPAAHAAVADQILAAGKSVWNEKPLTLDRPSAKGLLDRANSSGLRVGCAPDTFLGAGMQAARRRIEAGALGPVQSALVLFQSPGPESWHPNPAFYFAAGGGPLLDMAPYYLTALVQVLGPVASVSALGSRARDVRVIGSGAKAGQQFDVTVATHTSALLQFERGPSATMIFSFDSPRRRTLLEVSGTDATMVLPDPNTFGGQLAVQGLTDAQPVVVETTTELSARGTGVLDMARAIREGRPHRGSGELAYHVLDVMLSVLDAIDAKGPVAVTSTVEPAALLPDDWDPTAATL